MTFVELKVPAIDNYKGAFSSHTDGSWSFEALAAELQSVEAKLHAAFPHSHELKLGSLAAPRQTPPPAIPVRENRDGERRERSHHRSGRGMFVMRAPSFDSDGEGGENEDAYRKERSRSKMFVMEAPLFIEDEDDDDVTDSQASTQGTIVSAARPDHYLSESDNSDAELGVARAHHFMQKPSTDESLLLALESEHHSKMKESIRKRRSELEALIMMEHESLANALHQIKVQVTERQELDKELDNQYRRKVSEELDRHLATVRKNYAQRSHVEEMRIKEDAAIEEAKRREEALLEQRTMQERENAEAEARRVAEEDEKAALDAQIRDTKEAVDESTERNLIVSSSLGQNEAVDKGVVKAEGLNRSGFSSGQLYNEAKTMLAQQDIDSYSRQIGRRLRQITATVDIVRSKASELTRMIKDPKYPHSVSLLIFAKMVVGLCENPSGRIHNVAFACGHVIVLVASQVPDLIDILLGEFHRACIYTVPKHIQATEVISLEYLKLVGYREENGKIETSEKYRERVEAYMELYGALVQTEIPGVQNPLGLKKGWAWLARFLNELPANAATATALYAFLKMTGYALFRKYKSQFRKIMAVVSDSFVPALKARQSPVLAPIISKLDIYVGNKEYLNEPEGWRLRTHLSSHELI